MSAIGSAGPPTTAAGRAQGRAATPFVDGLRNGQEPGSGADEAAPTTSSGLYRIHLASEATAAR